MGSRQFILLRTRWALLLLVAGMLACTGCDSNDDGDDEVGEDAKMLVGIWNATSIMAGPIDVYEIAGVELMLFLEENGDVRIDATDEDGVVSGISGTYVVDDVAKTLTLDGDTVEDNIVMDYVLADQNTLSVDFDGADLANLGIDLGAVGDLIANLQIEVGLTRDES